MDPSDYNLLKMVVALLGVVSSIIAIIGFLTGKFTLAAFLERAEVARPDRSLLKVVVTLLGVVSSIAIVGFVTGKLTLERAEMARPGPAASAVREPTATTPGPISVERLGQRTSPPPSRVAPPRFSSEEADVRSYLRRAQDSFDHGNCDAALRECEEGLHVQPDSEQLKDLRDRIIRTRERGLC